MPPKPCAHCGLNFFKSTHELITTNLCNNCLNKSQKNPNNEVIMTNLDIVSILIELPLKMQIEIEELCINEGISFSKYFINLHEAATHGDSEENQAKRYMENAINKDFKKNKSKKIKLETLKD